MHLAFATMIKVSLRAEEVVQLVKYLPYKSEDLSLNPPEPTSKEGCIAFAYNPRVGEAEVARSLGSLVTQPRGTGESRFGEFQKQGGK